MGQYFCDICKFYDDETEKEQFHCDECGICRVGGRENFFHCQKCGSCYAVGLTHPCIENSMKCFCPVCYEYLLDSVKGAIIMKCGHAMHTSATVRWQINMNVVVPFASRRYLMCITNGGFWMRRLKPCPCPRQIKAMPMPETYKFRSSAMTATQKAKLPFTFLGHKCLQDFNPKLRMRSSND